jgi:tetratricopeptide (TPR) repeat protein
MKQLFLSILLFFPLLANSGGLPRGSFADKETAARTIFDRLVVARGDKRLAPPEFIFSATKSSGARAEGGQVMLEELAYDVCSRMGEDGEAALAGLLGHELIHYYEKHEWERGFISVVAGEEAVQTNTLQRAVREDLFGVKKDEIEADYLGGFLAHLAGFPSTEVMPSVLAGIYEAYELEEELSKYPSLGERQLIARETHRELQKLIHVFTMGNALTTLGQYTDAATYYQYVLDDFQSREIYNNLGVVYVQAALPLFREATVRYIYPVELDLNSRLDGQTRNVGVDQETRELYLREALRNFQRATLLDEQYGTALINLACTHALLASSILESPTDSGQEEIAKDHLLEAGIRARAAIRQAMNHQQAQTAANGYLLLGIIAEAEGKEAALDEAWSRAEASPLTALNQSIRETGKLPPGKERLADDFTMEEMLNERSILDLQNRLPAWDQEIMVLRAPDRIKLQIAEDENGGTTLLRHEVNGGQQAFLLYRPKPGYRGVTALELALGASREDILEEYDQPDYFVPTAGGLTMVYEDSGIVFVLLDDKLVSWWLVGGMD